MNKIEIGCLLRCDDIELKDNFGVLTNIEKNGLLEIEYENTLFYCSVEDVLEVIEKSN